MEAKVSMRVSRKSPTVAMEISPPIVQRAA
jgi:hypothetical protein